MANKLGITKNAISKWERGISLMDISLLKEVSSILNVSIVELLAGKELEKINYRTYSNRENKTFYLSNTYTSLLNDVLNDSKLEYCYDLLGYENDYDVVAASAKHNTKSTIFSSTKDIKYNYCLDSIKINLPVFNNFIKITGDLDGFILENDTYYSITVKKNYTYSMLLTKGYTFDQVVELLSTIDFNE